MVTSSIILLLPLLTLYLLNAEWNYFYLKQSRGKWVRLPQQLLKIRYDLFL